MASGKTTTWIAPSETRSFRSRRAGSRRATRDPHIRLPLRRSSAGFDPSFVLPTRHSEEQESIRLGARYIFTPNVDLCSLEFIRPASMPRPSAQRDERSRLDTSGGAKSHYIGRSDLIAGAGRLDGAGGTFGFFSTRNKNASRKTSTSTRRSSPADSCSPSSSAERGPVRRGRDRPLESTRRWGWCSRRRLALSSARPT
jgi:hypothetical protein